MKLYEILTEGWFDKFAKIQADIANLTLPQAAEYLKDKFGVDVDYKRGGKKPMSTSNVSTDGSTITITVSKDVKLGQSWYKKDVELTKVHEVNGLFQAFRHELQHVMQHKDGDVLKKNYRQARGGDDPTPSEKELKFFRYIIQPAERPTASLDLALNLREQGKTVDDLVSAVNKIATGVVHTINTSVLMSGTLKQLKEPSNIFSGNLQYYVGKLGAGLGVSQAEGGPAAKSDKAQYHQFIKALHNQYKRSATRSSSNQDQT